ncbi:MAG: hypothetical protein ABSD58_12100 [Verrucomicrobiia bacterium]|jgi:hypothetical protein
MEHVFKHERLPSGKVVIKHFGEDGTLVAETHTYGCIDISIQYNFKTESKFRETYFVKSRLVSRRSYENARSAYTDMPPSDGSLEDGCAELLSKERRRRSVEAKRRRLDADQARKNDAFCSGVMHKGRKEDAIQWIQTRSHTLGEREWSSSKRLVDRLAALGCVNIYACEIDIYEGSLENTGHLVVELPTAAAARGKIFKMIDRLARETGYDGPLDDGQRYAYVKLD